MAWPMMDIVSAPKWWMSQNHSQFSMPIYVNLYPAANIRKDSYDQHRSIVYVAMLSFPSVSEYMKSSLKIRLSARSQLQSCFDLLLYRKNPIEIRKCNNSIAAFFSSTHPLSGCVPRGAPINVIDKFGQTPLFRAAQGPSCRIIQYYIIVYYSYISTPDIPNCVLEKKSTILKDPRCRQLNFSTSLHHLPSGPR